METANVFIEESKHVSIEQQFLKGVSLRLIVALILCTATVCSTVTITYYSFKATVQAAVLKGNDHDARFTSMDVDNKTRDIQIRAMQIQLNTLEIRINQLEKLSDHFQNK
ncbi:MAG: hypothetical protein V4450_07490 [Bacteroidota bacterium]